MGSKKKVEKEYRLNIDTISINLEESSSALGLFPYSAEVQGQEALDDPRKLRRKGISIGGLDKKFDDTKYSKKKLKRQGKNINELAMNLNIEEHVPQSHEEDIEYLVSHQREFYKKGVFLG